MFYTRLQVICDPDYAEILMAEIAEAGFDTFMETEKGFEAYAEGDKYDRDLVQLLQEKYKQVNPLLMMTDRVEKKNWNEEWEKNLQPIRVDDQILVRAHFHPAEQSFPYEIIITPKMSFGTGHHQTTYLMLKNQLAMNHAGKRVMDAGCGTGILSIMAAKLGAAEIEAFDIDEWSIENGNENVEVNGVSNIRIRLGKISQLNFFHPFDIILANINKNILLEEMPLYATQLKEDGFLMMSGFYTHDIADLLAAAAPFGLREVHRDERESWAALVLKKYTQS